MCFIEGSNRLLMTTLSASDTSEILHSEVALEHSTGIHHLRYPVRLPMFRPEVWEYVDGRVLHPVVLRSGEAKLITIRLPGGRILYPVHPGGGETLSG